MRPPVSLSLHLKPHSNTLFHVLGNPNSDILPLARRKPVPDAKNARLVFEQFPNHPCADCPFVCYLLDGIMPLGREGRFHFQSLRVFFRVRFFWPCALGALAKSDGVTLQGATLVCLFCFGCGFWRFGGFCKLGRCGLLHDARRYWRRVLPAQPALRPISIQERATRPKGSAQLPCEEKSKSKVLAIGPGHWSQAEGHAQSGSAQRNGMKPRGRLRQETFPRVKFRVSANSLSLAQGASLPRARENGLGRRGFEKLPSRKVKLRHYVAEFA